MSKTVRAVLPVLVVLFGSVPAALAVTPIDVVVEDRAGVLDRNTLVPARCPLNNAMTFKTPRRTFCVTPSGQTAPSRGSAVGPN